MASYRIEDAHVAELSKLLSASGVECLRPITESTEEQSVSEESVEEAAPVEEIESVPEEESKEEDPVEPQEVTVEEAVNVFPTPSLRRVLPDKIRHIEEQNRIHVLPEEFKTDIDPQAIPKIANTAQQKYIDILAELVGCTKYKSSLAEFWFLDTLANLLRRAQEDCMDRPTQVVLIHWFCEFMKEIQFFDAASRERMLRRFQDNMLSAARFVSEEDHIPTPAEAGIHYKALEETERQSTAVDSTPTKSGVTFGDSAFECSLSDLTRILHYIFDLFSTDYQYNLIRSIFTTTPEYVLIDAPYQLQNPKTMYNLMKGKPKKEKSPKKDKSPPPVKGKKKETDPSDYLALLELKARDDRDQEEREEIEREEWNKKSHILPLSFAAGEELFNKYWPPPAPDPDPQPEQELKKKGKGKK